MISAYFAVDSIPSFLRAVKSFVLFWCICHISVLPRKCFRLYKIRAEPLRGTPPPTVNLFLFAVCLLSSTFLLLRTIFVMMAVSPVRAYII